MYRDGIDQDLVHLDTLLADPAMAVIAELAGSILDRLRPLDLPNGMAPGPALAPLEAGSGRNP